MKGVSLAHQSLGSAKSPFFESRLFLLLRCGGSGIDGGTTITIVTRWRELCSLQNFLKCQKTCLKFSEQRLDNCKILEYSPWHQNSTLWMTNLTAHHPKNTRPTLKFGGRIIMAWSCFSANVTSKLHVIEEGEINAQMFCRKPFSLFPFLLCSIVSPWVISHLLHIIYGYPWLDLFACVDCVGC